MNKTWMEILGEAPTDVESKMLKEIGNPIERMERIYELITSIIEQLRKLLEQEGVDQELTESYLITPDNFAKIFHSSAEDVSQAFKEEEENEEEIKKKVEDANLVSELTKEKMIRGLGGIKKS